MNIYKQKFITQRTGARNRGIEWYFTFEEWMAWWGDDIANRGNRSGQLVMARYKDQGPYHPDNVRKITCNENHSEAHRTTGCFKGKKHTEETKARIKASTILAKRSVNKTHTIPAEIGPTLNTQYTKV